MQSPIVIFALGLGLLLGGCAVQDLPFSGSAGNQNSTTPTPYTPPQPGTVHDGSTDGGDGGFAAPQPIPAHQVPMPASTPSTAGSAHTPQSTQSSHGTEQNGMGGVGQSTPAAPRPVTRTATGLQEREL